MGKNLFKLGFAMLCTLILSNSIYAQTAESGTSDSKIKLNIGADIVSRYVWRGIDFGNSPAIQPTISMVAGNFELGLWGSVSTQNAHKEVDLYAKYTYKNFTLSLTDYYIPTLNGMPSSPDPRLSIFDNKKTAHAFEGSLLFKGGEKLPLWISANTFFYGNDKRWGYDAAKDTTDGTYFSTYFEAGYSLAVGENNLDIFMGATPFAGQYGNGAGITNLGITASRKIKITDKYDLPIKASFIMNPQTSDFYFVFGITL